MQQGLKKVQLAMARLRQIPEYHTTRLSAEKIGQTSAEPDANSGDPSKMTKAMRAGGMCLTACFCRDRTHQPPGCVCVLDTAAWTVHAAYQNSMGQNTLLNTAVP